jgi:hypothetical protein
VKLSKIVLVPVLSAALLTTGCGSTDRVAAHVGDETVSTSDVDVLSEMQCALVQDNPTQPGKPTVRVLRNASVDALVHMEVVRQLVDAREAGEYDVSAYRQQIAGVDEALKAVPAGERERAIELLKNYTRGDLQLQHIATEQLAQEGTTNPTPQQVDETAAKIYEDFRKEIDVEVNPAYSPDESGRAGQQDGSLSVPVSSYAKQTEEDRPDAAWVSSLPAKLRCG